MDNSAKGKSIERVGRGNQDIDYFELAQQIDFSQKHPILDIAARFWEEDRYNAAKICYLSMRLVDDLVDNRKANPKPLSETEIRQFTSLIREWVEVIEGAKKPVNVLQEQLIETTQRFHIPLWPWEEFAKSMIYDLNHNGFRTFSAFLEYSEGASVAPASIFLHFAGLVKEDGHYCPPEFDIRLVARPSARFCYLVHIIRDFEKDQRNRLNYFTDDLMTQYDLNTMRLRKIAAGEDITPQFRNLIASYYKTADYYKRETQRSIENLRATLSPRYLLSVEILFSLYLQIFERIDITTGRFTSEELNPTPKEIKDRIFTVITKST